MKFYFWKIATASGSILSKDLTKAASMVNKILEKDLQKHEIVKEEHFTEFDLGEKLKSQNHFFKRDF